MAYHTSYLKHNHPIEWMCALLSNEPDNDKLSQYLAECRRMGINLLPPDVTLSGPGFTPTEEGIRYGLASVKGVGEKAVAGITSANGFSGLSDWYRRAPAGALNAGVLATLVRSGALDRLGSREGHLTVCDTLAERAVSERRHRRQGQRGVVGPRYTVPERPVDLAQRRRWERETLGVELSTGTLEIRATQILQESDLLWVDRVVSQHPGIMPARLVFGRVEVPVSPVSAEVTGALGALGKLEIKEVVT